MPRLVQVGNGLDDGEVDAFDTKLRPEMVKFDKKCKVIPSWIVIDKSECPEYFAKVS